MAGGGEKGSRTGSETHCDFVGKQKVGLRVNNIRSGVGNWAWKLQFHSPYSNPECAVTPVCDQGHRSRFRGLAVFYGIASVQLLSSVCFDQKTCRGFPSTEQFPGLQPSTSQAAHDPSNLDPQVLPERQNLGAKKGWKSHCDACKSLKI